MDRHGGLRRHHPRQIPLFRRAQRPLSGPAAALRAAGRRKAAPGAPAAVVCPRLHGRGLPLGGPLALRQRRDTGREPLRRAADAAAVRRHLPRRLRLRRVEKILCLPARRLRLHLLAGGHPPAAGRKPLWPLPRRAHILRRQCALHGRVSRHYRQHQPARRLLLPLHPPLYLARADAPRAARPPCARRRRALPGGAHRLARGLRGPWRWPPRRWC